MLRVIILSVLMFMAGFLVGHLAWKGSEKTLLAAPLVQSIVQPGINIADKASVPLAPIITAGGQTQSARPTASRFSEEEKARRLMQTAVNKAGLVVDMDHQFGEFFRQRKLDPQKAAQLRQALASRENIKYIVQVALENDGLERDAAMAAELTQAEEAKVDLQMKEILGPEGLKAFYDYSNGLYQNGVASAIGVRLRNLHLDLDDEQRSMLVSAHLAAEPQPFSAPPWNADVETFDKYFKQQNSILESLLDMAGKKLSEAQQQEIRRYFDEKLEPLRKLREINVQKRQSANS